MVKSAQTTKPSSKVGITLVIIGALLFFFIIIPLFLFIALIGAVAGGETQSTTGANVAHITISGTILTETSTSFFDASGDTSSRKIVKTLADIKDDDAIKGVIFEINSPGGSGVASDEIASAIRALDKPTVSYIREVGASGSYWVASATDYIYANRFSTVGSIGVIASYLDFSEFIEEYNVSYQRFVAGKNKDFGSPFREVTPEQEVRFQAILDELHTIFIQEVANGRNASLADITELADGSIFTGNQALANGLVDAIGSKEDAIRYIEKQIGEQAELTTYQKAPSFFESLAGYSTNNFYALGLGIGKNMKPDAKIGADNPLIVT